jgi:nitrate/nitrite transporter NarK
MASIFGAIAIPAIADRTGRSKGTLIALGIATAAIVGLFALPRPALYWALIPLAGAVTQGIGTIVIARAVQLKGTGLLYAGTALGLIGGMANLGGFVMPAIGGKLAEVDKAWPFFLWALMGLAGTFCFIVLKDERARDRGMMRRPRK